LGDIATYSNRSWGEAKTRTYIAAIMKLCDELGSGDLNGQIITIRRRDFIRARSGRHIVFAARSEAEPITIVRILHESMDIPSHLDP
jgi:plasmid stabilization system protein ParE